MLVMVCRGVQCCLLLSRLGDGCRAGFGGRGIGRIGCLAREGRGRNDLCRWLEWGVLAYHSGFVRRCYGGYILDNIRAEIFDLPLIERSTPPPWFSTFSVASSTVVA